MNPESLPNPLGQHIRERGLADSISVTECQNPKSNTYQQVLLMEVDELEDPEFSQLHAALNLLRNRQDYRYMRSGGIRSGQFILYKAAPGKQPEQMPHSKISENKLRKEWSRLTGQ